MALKDKRDEAERLYVRRSMTCPAIAAELFVNEGTVYRWKTEAAEKGDAADWDTQRRIYNMSPKELTAIYAESVKTWLLKIKENPAEVRGKPSWKESFPASRLEKLKKTIGSLAYAQEYLLVPIALDERIFKEEHLKGYAPEELIGTRFAYVFSWTDPSVKHEEKHCYKATICAGITNEGIIYVLKARIRKESVARMVDGMYLVYTQCNPSWMFYEDNGGQALLSEVLDAKAEREGYHIPRRAETNTIHKDTRIEGTLSAPIENGVIRFDRTDADQKELIDELLQFPDGEYKDGPDALEGVVRKLQEAARKRRAGKPQTAKPRESARVLRGYE